MAHFQKSAKDRTSRFDAGIGRLVLTLGEDGLIDLWGGGPSAEKLIVDLNDPTIATVSEEPSTGGPLVTYRIRALKTGNAMLEARLFSQTPVDQAARRRLWFTMPTWAFIQLAVFGAEYRQGQQPWGNLKYGSMNPAHRNVQWTNMALAGCGPTSLAIVMDYLIRLDSPGQSVPASFPGIDPKDTMEYTSAHGRSADQAGQPQGTSGPEMVNNLSRWWPDYAGEKVLSVDQATALLRTGKPLLFLCNNGSTWKYDAQGNVQSKQWPGHFMVLLGVEHGGGVNQTFWISDPSLARTKYISRTELQNHCQIWHVYRR